MSERKFIEIDSLKGKDVARLRKVLTAQGYVPAKTFYGYDAESGVFGLDDLPTPDTVRPPGWNSWSGDRQAWVKRWTVGSYVYYEPTAIPVEMWINGPRVVVMVAEKGVVTYSNVWIATGQFDAHGQIGFAVVQAILGYATGGASSAIISAYNAVEVGDTQSIVKAVVSAYSYGTSDTALAASDAATAADAADAATAVEGSTMFEDFDWGSYTDDTAFDWDGFNFSSGEADVAFSDAQNVDFGFDVGEINWGDYETPTDYFGSDIYDTAGYGSSDVLSNNIPEVVTSDFGTTFDNLFSKDTLDTVVNGVKLAQQANSVIQTVKGATGGSGKTASSGSTSAKPSTGTGDVLSQIGQLFNSIKGTTTGGVGSQVTTQVKTQNVGQLAPNGQRDVVGGLMSNNTLLIGGALLLIGALYLHSKS